LRFVLFWINGRGTLLLQFIKIYMLFRMPPAPYCLRPPNGRDCQESVFGRLKQVISIRKSSLSCSLSARRKWAYGHELVLKCVATGFARPPFDSVSPLSTQNSWLSSQEPYHDLQSRKDCRICAIQCEWFSMHEQIQDSL